MLGFEGLGFCEYLASWRDEGLGIPDAGFKDQGSGFRVLLCTTQSFLLGVGF